MSLLADENGKKSRRGANVGIERNDEPTRFFSPKEIDELEGAVFNGKPAAAHSASSDESEAAAVHKPSANIKIEDVKPSEMKRIKAEQAEPIQAGSGSGLSGTADYGDMHKQIRRAGRGKRLVKYFLLAMGFVIAIVAGFYLAFTWSTKSQSETNARAHDVQQLQQQEADLSSQREDLAQRRQQLEDEQRQLSEQRDALNGEKSFLASIMDKITGKEAEQKAQSSELEAKMDKAQSMIDELNAQIKDLDSLKSRASQMKQDAQSSIAGQDGSSALNDIKAQVQSFINKFLQ